MSASGNPAPGGDEMLDVAKRLERLADRLRDAGLSREEVTALAEECSALAERAEAAARSAAREGAS